MKFKKLPRSFYLRPTLIVAKDLLGKHLCRRIGKTLLIGKIVEVEAYLGVEDPASHAYRGLTKRNEVMFGKGGHLYVYFTYGMHYCCNVVTEEAGTPGAVLLRAVEPVGGIDVMRKKRKCTMETIADRKLTNGPAKICKAFGIARKENGTDLLGDEIFIAEGESTAKSAIVAATRIGIRQAMEKEWRFYVKGSEFVSRLI